MRKKNIIDLIEDSVTYGSGLWSSSKIRAELDAVSLGYSGKADVEVVTEGSNITLSGLQTFNSYTLLDGDRVGVTSQTNPIENGIYIASTGAWVRSTDYDGPTEVKGGTFFFVSSNDNTYARARFIVLGTSQINVGTDAINYSIQEDVSENAFNSLLQSDAAYIHDANGFDWGIEDANSFLFGVDDSGDTSRFLLELETLAWIIMDLTVKVTC